MRELVSVIVPVYNVKNYLNRCLESIVNQTYENLEIIVVDDGSTDGSGLLCDEWERKDKRIQVFHQENQGLSAARNEGLRHVNGEYIAFVDSDDCIHLNMYELLCKAMQEHKCDIVLCHEYEFHNQNEILAHELINKYTMEQVWDKKETVRQFQMNFEIVAWAWNKLYKAEIIKNIRFTKGIVGCEDWDFNLDVMMNVEKSVLIKEKLYYYFQREDSITHLSNEKPDAYYLQLADLYVKQAENIWKIKDETLSIENANYCLNRLARFSARKDFSNRKNVQKGIYNRFKKLYNENKKYIFRMPDATKLILARRMFPVYKVLIR